MSEKYTHDELVGSLKSTGWRLTGGGADTPVTGSLEEVLAAAHRGQASGGAPTRIERVENAIELDLMQIEMLWRYLGLPV